ncbi:MAG: hypothetical protein EXS33_07830 [Pedosphaera sp.]|nr:hypothetical protein [Pedosphaera sp.]
MHQADDGIEREGPEDMLRLLQMQQFDDERVAQFLVAVGAVAQKHDAGGGGDECWSRDLMGWKRWSDAGLTQHRNWWPEVYREACQSWGVEPDPKILAFNTSYKRCART